LNDSSQTLPASEHLGVRAPRSARFAFRLRLAITALVALAGAASLAIALNNWAQRDWLQGKWLYRMPGGLLLPAVFAALTLAAACVLAWMWRTGRWRSTSLAPLRWLLIAGLGAWIFVWTVPPPTVVYDAQLALCGAAAAWSIAVVLQARRFDSRWPRALRWLEIGLCQIALIAFAAEAGLRMVRNLRHVPLLATRGTDPEARIRALRLAAGSFHLGFPVNADGYVDVEPAQAAAARHRVACIGDSFSVGVVPHHLHYTTQAERAFAGLEVYNIGVVDTGPAEYRRMLELHALPLEPQLIVVALFLGNDVGDARRNRIDLRASLMDRDEVLLLQAPLRLLRLQGERRAGAGIASGGGRNMLGLPDDQAFTPEELERRVPWLADPLREPPVMSAERYAYVESARIGITLPEQRAEYDDFFAALQQLRASAGPVPLAFLLIPDEFQVEEALWRQTSAPFPRAVRELPQELVSAWLEERELAYVDLLPRLRAVEPLADGARHVYHLRDSHFNARGNALAAAALAELIEASGVARRTQR